MLAPVYIYPMAASNYLVQFASGTGRRFAAACWLCFACWAVLVQVQAAPLAPERWAGLAHSAFKNLRVPLGEDSRAMAQDHDGFIWIGTQTGLVRWDGYRARRYGPDLRRADALPDGYIISLYVDPRGRLWIGTSSGGLARYDSEHDNFVVYPASPSGISHARVAALAGDGAGGVWIGTGAGIDHMGADGVLARGAGLPAGGVDALLTDRRGNLWAGTSDGLFRRAPGELALRPVALPVATPQAPAINVLYQDSGGRVWVGTRHHGAMVFAEGAAQAQAVQASGAKPTLEGEQVFAITEVGPHEVWLGMEGTGIVAVDPRGGPARRIRHQTDVPDSLNDNDVMVLFRERSGLIFISSAGALSLHDPHPTAILTLRQSGSPVDGPLSIPSLLQRADGRAWLGVAGGAIHIIDPLGGAAGYLGVGAPPAGAGLPSGRVLAMANGPAGEVYIGTQHGLFRTGPDGKQALRLSIPGRDADAGVWALAFQHGALWLGGRDGLWQIAPDPGPAARLLRHESDSLGERNVTALLPLAGGGLWIGTRAGLAYLDGPGAKVERVPTGSAPGTLPPGYVSSLLLDRGGRLWASIYGSGVAVLEHTDSGGRRRFRSLGTADGLQDGGANALLEDGQGMIWASTDAGLATIDPATYAVVALGASDGVHIAAYWTNSRALGGEGELLFGGLTGLTVVRPALRTPWTYAAPLALTSLSVNDVGVPAGPFNGAARAARRPARLIEIAPEARERGFSLEFAALDYSAPEQNRYAYRLLGFDPHWIEADAGARRISYNNLPPGDYTLLLRGSNRAGAWSPLLEVPVRALPSWDQLLWVRIAFGIAGALLVVLLDQVRTGFLRRRQRELEALVSMRTQELQASQRQLEIFAYSDPLTGLPNRRCFNDELRHMAARAVREHDSFALLLIDLDHFKQVNDTHGHDAGDTVLVEAARRLKQAVRESDRVARLGGDEFAVLLAHTGDKAAAGVICARIVASMAEPIAFGAHHLTVSASVGAAAFGELGANLDALYKAADEALYDAKRRGRNGWSWERAAIAVPT